MSKMKISAENMVKVRELSNRVRRMIEDEVQDISIDIVTENRPELDIDNDDHEEILLDLEIEIEGILVDMILQDIRREF
jgi:hypothetical protein